jgi:hypothetical protein
MWRSSEGISNPDGCREQHKWSGEGVGYTEGVVRRATQIYGESNTDAVVRVSNGVTRASETLMEGCQQHR